MPAGLLLSPHLEAEDVKGVVLNAESGEKLEKVTLYLSGAPHRTVTGADGSFVLPDVRPGRYLLVASAVGFGLLKKEIEVAAAEILELEILLHPGTRLAEELTVTGKQEPGTELDAAEIHRLKSVLADDPIRALQQLPGVIAGDDFNSGVALQGSGFDRVGILLDGVPVYAFLHTMQGAKDSGSTTLLSADLIEEVDLVRGGTSAEWGGNSAGFLRLRTRSGNTLRWRNLLSVSGTSALIVSEGPVGKGSWIASARKSYMDWIVRRIDPRLDLNFGFSDFSAKLTQGAGTRHLFALSFFHGKTGVDNVVENIGLNAIYKGRLSSDLVRATWTWSPSGRLNAETHLYWQQSEGLNRNREGRVIWTDDLEVAGVRSVWNARIREGWMVSFGMTAEAWEAANRQELYGWRTRSWASSSDFRARAARQEAFGQARIPLRSSLALLCGWSAARFSVGPQTSSSPYLGLEFSPSARQQWTLFLGGTQQFPFFHQLFGEAGNAGLGPEAARTVQGGWNYHTAAGLQVRLSAYGRRRRAVAWRRHGLWRLVNGAVAPPSPDPFQNVLRDHSSGAEVQVGRKAANGLSGWAGYAWGRSRWSEEAGAWFPGNYDQRHSASFFAQYRWSSQLDLSLKWKYASGLPIPAYVAGKGDRYFLSAGRNLERLQPYSRLDLRMAKTLNRDRYRWTLFLEVLNLLGRENQRFSGFGLDFINHKTGEVRELVQGQFPFLPTAGFLLEF